MHRVITRAAKGGNCSRLPRIVLLDCFVSLWSQCQLRVRMGCRLWLQCRLRLARFALRRQCRLRLARFALRRQCRLRLARFALRRWSNS